MIELRSKRELVQGDTVIRVRVGVGTLEHEYPHAEHQKERLQLVTQTNEG